jgi:hypothetical protein
LNDEFGGIDGLTRWLGLRWESPYSMGSVLWQARRGGERIATIGISINYVQTAREGEIVCTSTLDRHDRGPAAPEEIAEAE